MHKEQLEYFAFAYQTRNYSTAAKLIPMSPQGLAKSIHSLENELGVTLFFEKNGVLAPTPYADELLSLAAKWVSDYQELKNAFRKIKAHEHHEIRLGTSSGIMSFMGVDFLDSFTRENPSIEVVYDEVNDAVCEMGLLKGNYDLAFTLAPYDKHFITAELYSAQVHLWTSSQSASSFGASIGISDLADKNLAIPGKDFKIYDTIMNACASQGVELCSVFTSCEILWIYDYVASGKGLAFTLPHLIDMPMFFGNKDLVALPLEGISWRFGISYLFMHQLLPHEKLFIDYCLARSRSLHNR